MQAGADVVVERVVARDGEAVLGEQGGDVELAAAEAAEAGGSDKRLLQRGQTIAMLWSLNERNKNQKEKVIDVECF